MSENQNSNWSESDGRMTREETRNGFQLMKRIEKKKDRHPGPERVKVRWMSKSLSVVATVGVARGNARVKGEKRVAMPSDSARPGGFTY